jgi:hypothetical protein
MNHTKVRITIIVEIAASILVVGTSVNPIFQQTAYEGGHRYSSNFSMGGTKRQEQTTIQDVRANFKKSDISQHMDLGNLS